MPATSPCALSPEQLRAYHQQGFLLIPQAVRPATLALAQDVLERWVDRTAAEWQAAGWLTELRPELPFDQRLIVLWHAAGKPRYSRSPRRELVCPELFDLLCAPELLDVAEALLGTPEVSLHGIFNARPKLPDQRWTDTPWHQDAQYFRDAERVHVPTFWFPLQDVTPHNSCLQVQPGGHLGALHEGHDDPETGFLGLAPEVRQQLQGLSIGMARGDLLCFTQLTPHGALPNQSDRIRWSFDFRYEDTDHPTQSGRDLGFVARSRTRPLTHRDEWLARWDHRPAKSY